MFGLFRSCGGGHVWGEWEPTDWWEILPFNSSDEQTLRRKYRRTCERSDCGSYETEMRDCGRMDAHEANERLESLPKACEPTYECPQCLDVVAYSDIRTVHSRTIDGGKFQWKCPECCHDWSQSEWTLVRSEDD